MAQLTQRCSTIFISIGDKTLVYHSVDEIPSRLRERLVETTQGANSATILIADRDGREQILHAVRRTTSLDRSSTKPTHLGAIWSRGWPRLTWNGLGRFLVLGGLGYILYLLISVR